MMTSKYIPIAVAFIFSGCSLYAQELNTEITVNHEVVPEEQAATRMRILPTVSLPGVSTGRLPVASRFLPSEITPYINPLSAAQYADSIVKSPWRGYAGLGYGPVYNLTASAGYRIIDQSNLTLDGYMQFDGTSYTSKYPGIDYDGKVCFRRNTALAGARTLWNAGNGLLDASILYQYSGYNFPILDLATKLTDRHKIDANVVKASAGWGSHVGKVDYKVNLDYDMIYFGRDKANNNRFNLATSFEWEASHKSSWGVDLGYSFDHSAIVGNKGIVHILPKYSFSSRNVKLGIGVDLDIATGNARGSHALLVSPDFDIVWQPWTYMSVWGKVNGHMDSNSRSKLFDEQPYLLPDFDAAISRVYNGDAGLTFGPFRGARIDVFGGYTMAYDWYMPAITTGYMTAMTVKGWHGGAALTYDYRHYLSLNVKAEVAESPRGNYSRGYAPWRDHARMNLMARATVRPIKDLEITLSYQLRTGRQKQLHAGNNLNLRSINNLQAAVSYRITDRWTAFVRGENLLNQHWYLGPAVPSQGILGLIGASYKF